MIIEFIGAPGAGKTTLVPALTGFFAEQGIRAFTVVDAARPCASRTIAGKAVNQLAPIALRRPLLWQLFYYYSVLYRLKFIALHPRLMWQVIRSQRKRPTAAETRRRKVSYWFYRLIGYYEFLKVYSRPDEVLVFDEGFLHRVVQLFSSHVEKPSAQQIEAYVNLLPRPDLVIFIRAPREVCEQRLYSRGLWARLQEKDPAEVKQFVSNAHLAVNLAVAHAKNQGWTVVDVNNEQSELNLTINELRHRLALIAAPAGKSLKVQTA